MLARRPTDDFRVVQATEEHRFDALSLQGRGLLLPPDERGDLQLLDRLVLGTEEAGQDGSSTAGITR